MKKKNLNVLITNITNVDQTVINIVTNEAMVISPGAGSIIDIYNKKHSYLYNSYARKGLKVEFVDDSIFENVNLEELKEEVPASEEISTQEVVAEVPKEEEKKTKRSKKKSNEESSESSEEVIATAESGE